MMTSIKILILKLANNYLGIAGGTGAGKTTIAKMIAEIGGYKILSLSDILREEAKNRGLELKTRDDYADLGDDMRRRYGYGIVGKRALNLLHARQLNRCIIEGFRRTEDALYLRRSLNDFSLIGVQASLEKRICRIRARLRDSDFVCVKDIERDMHREWHDEKPEGCKLKDVMEICDFYIDANGDIKSIRAEIENLLLDAS